MSGEKRKRDIDVDVDVDMEEEGESCGEETIGPETRVQEYSAEEEKASGLRYDSGQFFAAYQDDYCLPAPSHFPEFQRLNYFHEAYKQVVGLLPDRVARFLEEDGEHHILDVGSGTGIWAVEVASRYQACQVMGIDLVDCPVSQPPSNCRFEVQDVYRGTRFDDETFDVVHLRDISFGIHKYQRLLQDLVRILKPGGYLCLEEVEAYMRTVEGTVAEKFPKTSRFLQMFRDALEERQLNADLGAMLEESVRGLDGLAEIECDRSQVPIGPWPEDPRLSHAGTILLKGIRLWPDATRVMMQDHGIRDPDLIGGEALIELEEGMMEHRPFGVINHASGRRIVYTPTRPVPWQQQSGTGVPRYHEEEERELETVQEEDEGEEGEA